MKRLSLSMVLSGEALHPMHAALDDGIGERAVLVDVTVSRDHQTFLYRVTGDRAAYERRLRSLAFVSDHETTPVDGETFYLLTRESLPDEQADMLASLTTGELLLSTPVTFLPGGRVELTVAGPADALQSALDGLPAGAEVTVDQVRDDPAVTDSLADRLTGRQREALATAVAVGYFDVPRSGTIESVAAELDCSTGTASEHLRKAQATLATAALE